MVERKVFTEGTSIDEIENFIKEHPDSNFIVNCMVGSEMMKKSSFNVSDASNSTHHLIFKVGDAHGKNIYVWAMMAAKDMSVYSVDDKFIEKFDRTPVDFFRYCGIEPDDYEDHMELGEAAKKVFGIDIHIDIAKEQAKDLKKLFDVNMKDLLKNSYMNEMMGVLLEYEMKQYAED